MICAALVFSVPVYASKSEMPEVYRCHDNAAGKIAITFDDGPHPTQTPEILDILAEYGVKATFFIVGKNAALHPDLICRTIDEGHELGNHTYSHIMLPGVRPSMALREITDCETFITETTDYRPKVMRPPGGAINKTVARIISAMDCDIVLWNIDTRDWSHPAPDKIVTDILNKVRSGDIILFHDYISGGTPTPEALRRVLPELLARGFRLVTVSELLGTK